MENPQTAEKNDVFNTEHRFERVQILRETLGIEPLEIRSYGSMIDTPNNPTIGIEIEMGWMQAFPDMGEEYRSKLIRPKDMPRQSEEYIRFEAAYDRHDKSLRPILEQIEQVIPRVGIDAYWEFSFLPSKHIGVTIAEVQTLYDATILHSDVPYATQMTVAGIDNDRDAYAFLCALELSGGSSAERIETAATSLKGTWARKGKGGILKRRPEELMGMDTKAYEFRTLIATSAQQLTSLLLTAQQLAVLHQQDPEAWKEFRTHIESIIKDHGLHLSSWGHPRQNQGVWAKYGELLNK